MSRLWTPNEIQAIAAREVNRRRGVVHLPPHPFASSQRDDQFRFINTTGDTIPAHALLKFVEVVDITEEADKTIWVLDVQQYDGEPGVYFVNSPIDIPYNGDGYCTRADVPTKVMIDPSATASDGAMFGPTQGQWYLSENVLGPYVFLGLNDGTIALFQTEHKPESLVIGVTLGSTSAITGTVNSRPFGWSQVPGEVSGVVSITNPSSLTVSSTGLSFHAAYCTRNDTDQWELIGSVGGASAEQAYGCLSINGTTIITAGSTYQKVSIRTPDLTAFGLTASTATFDFTIATEGDYRIEYHIDSLVVDSLAGGGNLVNFAVFRNSSGVGNTWLATQVTAGVPNELHEAVSRGGMAHLYSGDVVDLRTFGSTAFAFRAGMDLELIRATTST